MNIDNQNIDLNLFRTFYIVAESGSISKAAERLFVSQPSISYSIKNLETALDVKLFNRTGKGVELTTEGKNLMFYVESAYNSLCIGERAINFKLNSQMAGELAIGVPSHIGVFYLSKFLLNFHNKYPNMKIHILNGTTTKLVELLELHKLDLIIDATPIVGKSKEFVVNHLTDFDCCFAVNKNNEIAKETKEYTYKELSELPLILPGEGTNTRNAIDNYFLKGNMTVNPTIEVSTTEMMIDFVKRDMGVGYFVEDSIVEQIEKGLFVKLNLKEPLPKQEVACAFIEEYLTIGAKKFIALLEEYGIKVNISNTEKPA